ARRPGRFSGPAEQKQQRQQMNRERAEQREWPRLFPDRRPRLAGRRLARGIEPPRCAELDRKRRPGKSKLRFRPEFARFRDRIKPPRLTELDRERRPGEDQV